MPRLTPSATLDELHPPRSVFAPRSAMERVQWVHGDPFRLDTGTGVLIALMGDMPLICHENTATQPILEFFRNAGLEPARSLSTYRDEAESVARARDYLARGWRLAYIYPPPRELSADAALIVPVSLYGQLNDKASLDAYVGSEHLPLHRVFPVGSLDDATEFLRGEAVFVKGCHAGASGAGADIRYCPDAASRADALEWLRSRAAELTGVRVEQALDIPSCWCVNIAVVDAGVRYLGAATQLFSAPGRQTGSRIDPDDLPSEAVVRIAMQIGEVARQQGYRGVAGLDIGTTRSGDPYVFDLNFRLAASTPQVLLHEAAVARVGARISCSFNVLVHGPIEVALARVAPFAREGRFVPTRLYDATPLSDHRSVVTGFVVGRTIEAADRVEQGLRASLGELLAA
jgi:hypothetical protein